jgi:hypothetical protein
MFAKMLTINACNFLNELIKTAKVASTDTHTYKVRRTTVITVIQGLQAACNVKA